MKIRVTQSTEPRSWYKERIGQMFAVIREGKTIDGDKMFVIGENHIVISYVLAKDCVVVEPKKNENENV